MRVMMGNRAIPSRCHFRKLTTCKCHVIAIAFFAALSLASAVLHGQESPSLTFDQVRALLRIGAPDATIANEIASRGVAFQPSMALLTELEHEGAGTKTLATLRKLIPVVRAVCESFDACVSRGYNAFQGKQWNEAKAFFEQAAAIDPNSGQAWNALGKIYLALQQTQAAYSAWDKALNAQYGVGLTACMETHQPVCESGMLQLTPAHLVRYRGNDKVFEAPLSAVKVVGTIHHGSPSYLALEMLVNGTKYDFDFFPVGATCVWANVVVCPAEGQAEQMAMASYLEQTIRRLSSGGTEGSAIAPPVESFTKRDSPPVKIQVWHRHGPVGWGVFPAPQVTYCRGVLTIYLGIVEYNCTAPDRALGRCEHGMISPVRSVEYKGGGLRIVGRGGNWDFLGNSGDLRMAHDAIAATLVPRQ